jgi:hypothetical protein
VHFRLQRRQRPQSTLSPRCLRRLPLFFLFFFILDAQRDTSLNHNYIFGNSFFVRRDTPLLLNFTNIPLLLLFLLQRWTSTQLPSLIHVAHAIFILTFPIHFRQTQQLPRMSRNSLYTQCPSTTYTSLIYQQTTVTAVGTFMSPVPTNRSCLPAVCYSRTVRFRSVPLFLFIDPHLIPHTASHSNQSRAR